jgi:prevent-host-death family protein
LTISLVLAKFSRGGVMAKDTTGFVAEQAGVYAGKQAGTGGSPSPEPRTIPIHEAKSTLSQLVKRAAEGERIYIGGYGRAEAVLVSVDAIPRKKPVSEAYGCMKHMPLPEGWEDPLPDGVIESFYSMQGLEEWEIKD